MTNLTKFTKLERLALVLAVVMLIAIAWVNAALAAERFHIESGDATLTLNEFSRQSELQILFDFRAVHEVVTQPVDGELEADAALAAMLANSDLAFEFINERTVAVTLARAKPRSNTDTFAGIQGSGVEWHCSRLTYVYTLLGYSQSSWRGEFICTEQVTQL